MRIPAPVNIAGLLLSQRLAVVCDAERLVRRNERPWLAAISGCLLLQLALSLFCSSEIWTTPIGNGLFCLLALVRCVTEASRGSAGERWRWLLLATAFLLWVCQWAVLIPMQLVSPAGPDTVDLDTLFFAGRAVLLLVLLAPMGDIDDHVRFRWIDGLQGVLSLILLLLLLFPTWFELTHQAVGSRSAMLYRQLINIFLAGFSVFGVIFQRAPERRRLMFAISLLVLSYAASAFVINNFIIPKLAGRPGSMLLVIASLPSQLFLLRLTLSRPKPEATTWWSRLPELRLFAPGGLTAFLLLASFAIGHRHPSIGLAGGLATLALYVVRATVFQILYVRAQHEMARAAAEKADFLVNLSHEIRSPLCSLALVALRLSQSPTLADEEAQLAHQIHARSNQVIALLNDTLELARLDAGAARIAFRPYRAADVCREALETVRPQAADARVLLHLNVDADSSGFPVLGDAGRLRQVLVNITGNAIKFTPADGHVTLTATWVGQAGDHRLRITITDTGCGIHADARSVLFTRFGRAGAPINGAEGSGLGLVLSHKLIELMDGRLEVESIVGRGSRFCIDLPAPRIVK